MRTMPEENANAAAACSNLVHWGVCQLTNQREHPHVGTRVLVRTYMQDP